MQTFTPWRPLFPDQLAEVPDRPGVYELATLVRTIVYVGEAGNLASALSQHVSLAGGPSSQNRRYFRFVEVERPEQLQRQLLAEYQRTHQGALPAAQTAATLQADTRRHLKAV
jgi:hypothetical protein